MDTTEARAILAELVDALRTTSYPALVARLLGRGEQRDVVGASGTVYQVEVQAFWDRGAPGDLRVIVGIDDGGWRALRPLTVDFIVRPDGSFAGE